MLLNAALYVEEECIWLEYDAIEVAFCYVIRFF